MQLAISDHALNLVNRDVIKEPAQCVYINHSMADILAACKVMFEWYNPFQRNVVITVSEKEMVSLADWRQFTEIYSRIVPKCH